MTEDTGQMSDRITLLKQELDKLKAENDRLREVLGIPYGRRETDKTNYIATKLPRDFLEAK